MRVYRIPTNVAIDLKSEIRREVNTRLMATEEADDLNKEAELEEEVPLEDYMYGHDDDKRS